MPIRLATHNINSIRARIDRFAAWLERQQPDILCLQETKCQNEDFPMQVVEDAGYVAAIHGQKTYNGVAILAREGDIDDVICGIDDNVDDPQARLIAAEIQGIFVVNIYVPNGKTADSDHFKYKLAWLERFMDFLDRHASPERPMVVCGDFNIAPSDEDVAFPERWAGSVLCRPEVRDIFQRMRDWGMEDLLRLHQDAPGPYTWWDYRRLAFPKGDGIRIDHILATPPAAMYCTSAEVDRDERKGQKPSDHAPVFATFDL